MVNEQQIVAGIVKYIDTQVMPVVDTKSKWMIGTAITMLAKSPKANEMVKQLSLFGIEQDGMYDIDALADGLLENAKKYGKMTISFPIIGSMTFNEMDVELIRKMINEVEL